MNRYVRRLIAAIICIVIIAGVFPAGSLAADSVISGRCGDNLTWTITNKTKLTVSGSGPVVIDLNDRPWDYYASRIISIVIDSGVTGIGEYAFYGMESLETVSIPGTVASIGNYAFMYCTSLDNLTLPDSVRTIGEFAFGDCWSLTNITLPSGLKEISAYLFGDCSSLKSITIPDSVREIGDLAFSGCESLTSFTIPDNVEYLGNNVFMAAPSLAEIKVGSGNQAYCTDQRGVLYSKDKTVLIKAPVSLSGKYAVPGTVNAISSCAFEDCRLLTGITIPQSVASIGDNAFSNCSSITDITIPESVYDLGEAVFRCCSSLTDISIPETVTYIGYSMFYECTALKSIRLPDSLISISDNSFCGCSALKNITIPKNVQYIEGNAFYDCSSLSAIYVDKDNPEYRSDSMGAVLNKSMTEIRIIPPGLAGNYTIPSTVTAIGENAFYGCEHLTSITIPGSVRHISDGAFMLLSADLIFTGNPPETDGNLIENGSFTICAVTAFYPADNPAWNDQARRSFGKNIMWVPDNFDTAVTESPKDRSEPLTPASSYNLDANDYINGLRWPDKVRSYLVKNADGTFTRVEQAEDKVVIEDYDSGFKLRWKKTIAMEMPIWGGFYSGSEYNFFVFGQDNKEENDNKPVVRIVRYTKNWHRVDSAELCGANTVEPFRAGALRMTEKDSILYIHTCHKIYTLPDGLNHQTNMFIGISIPYMKIICANYHVGGFGYASHSFNQFILADDDYIVRLDHGDAYPRAIQISRFKGMGVYGEEDEIIDICGMVGDNDTGISVGGFEASDTCYLTAGNSVVQENKNFDPHGTRNIFVSATDKARFNETGSTEFRWITSYKDSDSITVSNPLLTEINNNSFILMWEETDANYKSVLRYVYLNGSGAPVSEIYQADYPMSDCQPVVSDGKLIWYVTENSAPKFYSINLSGTPSYEKGDVDMSGQVGNSDLIMVARHVVHILTLTGEQFTSGDMDGDGEISNKDII
ncbi:MAG: leucine-rich repeat protein, partial [Oscillospiraceae bacterium]|nr:leucine-rich repeat protein [Oscillospiraceae bacterium]